VTNWWFLAIAVVLSATSWSNDATACLCEQELSEPEAVAKADLVVRGRIVSVCSQLQKARSGLPPHLDVDIYWVQVESSIKGACTPVITIHVGSREDLCGRRFALGSTQTIYAKVSRGRAFTHGCMYPMSPDGGVDRERDDSAQQPCDEEQLASDDALSITFRGSRAIGDQLSGELGQPSGAPSAMEYRPHAAQVSSRHGGCAACAVSSNGRTSRGGDLMVIAAFVAGIAFARVRRRRSSCPAIRGQSVSMRTPASPPIVTQVGGRA